MFSKMCKTIIQVNNLLVVVKKLVHYFDIVKYIFKCFFLGRGLVLYWIMLQGIPRRRMHTP